MSMTRFRVRSGRAAARGVPFRNLAQRAVLAAVAIALSSCWHPAFDPAISGSEAVIRKLGAPIFESSTNIENGYEMENAWFLPTASNPITAGLLLVRAPFRLYVISGIDRRDVVNVFGDLYTAYAATDTSPEALILSEPTQGQWFDAMNPLDPSPTAFPYACISTFGIGLSYDSVLHQAQCLWIGYNSSSVLSYEVTQWTGGGEPVFGASINLIFSDNSFVSTPGRAYYLQNTGYYYLSCGLSDGSRVIYRWLNPSTQEPVRFPEVHGPLVGALSDGRLLAKEGEILSVLDPGLKREFSFPAGKLRFVHERYDGSQMIAVFTRTVFVRTSRDDDSGRLDVEVYEIPTADLHKLAD